MKTSSICLLAVATLGLASPLAVPALAQIITTNVQFPRGTTGTTVSGTIKGRQIRDYVVRASAGQVMSVRMRGARIVYFNIMPPGSQGEAIFVGSSSGDSFTGTLPKSGPYKIRVYQMRATARRGEVDSYRLSIDVKRGAGPSAGAGNAGNIAGIRGMDAVAAFDELRARGFRNVDSFSSGNTLYGIYYFQRTQLCVQTTSTNSRIVDIRDIRTHPKCR
ncbi:hypothetical protein [Novosphingobium album (ex Hu et al. 2023)]|uniref:DNA breaking-rejoining protein n=1 Tax=Novosphingobium album (ex Hu et al. 2023) TaxID=2930093 RepID=A0ABT0B0I4_9SPHN|nr:hypothetical protein [Novosphingobium album (ex Hu et al. 2023)]MCJ2178583.1 hypothetical protein [Novosphingobium album (ex Hu et al. 2023)]